MIAPLTKHCRQAKTERKFIKNENHRNTDVLQGFLTQRNFLYVENWRQGFVWGAILRQHYTKTARRLCVVLPEKHTSDSHQMTARSRKTISD
jgi:hypothetical protein